MSMAGIVTGASAAAALEQKRGAKPQNMDALDEAVWARKQIAKVNERATAKVDAIKAGLSPRAKELLAGK